MTAGLASTPSMPLKSCRNCTKTSKPRGLVPGIRVTTALKAWEQYGVSFADTLFSE
jgi:hypothetical protein